MKANLILVILMVLAMDSLAQQKAFTFEESEAAGKPYSYLDSLYKSALHSDTTLAVFKTQEEQKALQQAYFALIKDLNAFLKENDFNWETPTRCFNRIYFNPGGRIDYFLYNFPKDQISTEQEKEFARLVNLFAQDYQFALTAPENFAQCSPIVYSGKK